MSRRKALPVSLHPIPEQVAQDNLSGTTTCACQGRGWYTGDMMGSWFIPCDNCERGGELEMTPDGGLCYKKTREKKQLPLDL